MFSILDINFGASFGLKPEMRLKMGRDPLRRGPGLRPRNDLDSREIFLSLSLSGECKAQADELGQIRRLLALDRSCVFYACCCSFVTLQVVPGDMIY